MSRKIKDLKDVVASTLGASQPQEAVDPEWEALKARARKALEPLPKTLAPLKRPTNDVDGEGRPRPLHTRDRLTGATGRPVDPALVAPAAPLVDPVTGRERFRGRKMPPAALAEAYRHRGPLALDVLTKICTQYLRGDPTVSAGEAAKAAQLLTDRAYGKAPEVVHVQSEERDAKLVLRPSEMSTEDLVTYAALLRRNKAKLLEGRAFDSSGRLIEAAGGATIDAVTSDPKQSAD